MVRPTKQGCQGVKGLGGAGKGEPCLVSQRPDGHCPNRGGDAANGSVQIRQSRVSQGRQSGSRRPEPISDSDRVAMDLDQTDKEIHNRLASLLKQAEASTRANRGKPAPAVSPDPVPVLRAEPEAPTDAARPIALQSRAEREFMKALEARK